MQNRPFKDKEEFKSCIVKEFNNVAGTVDTIYVIGNMLSYSETDLSSWSENIHIVNEINAQVVLLIGNCESEIIYKYFADDTDWFRMYCKHFGFKDVLGEAYVSFGGMQVYLNHYPQNRRCYHLNLFGHILREGGLYRPYGLNIGCDVNNYKLWSEQDIIRQLRQNSKWFDIEWTKFT
jgi:calcineurin-like phosphoesterase family protein